MLAGNLAGYDGMQEAMLRCWGICPSSHMSQRHCASVPEDVHWQVVCLSPGTGLRALAEPLPMRRQADAVQAGMAVGSK